MLAHCWLYIVKMLDLYFTTFESFKLYNRIRHETRLGRLYQESASPSENFSRWKTNAHKHCYRKNRVTPLNHNEGKTMVSTVTTKLRRAWIYKFIFLYLRLWPLSVYTIYIINDYWFPKVAILIKDAGK